MIGECSPVACAVAEDHVHLLGLVEQECDLDGEQVADVHDLLAGVLECGHDADADRAALGGEDGERGDGPGAEQLVGLVGDQERHLVDEHQGERVGCGGGVRALEAGESVGPLLHHAPKQLDHDLRLPCLSGLARFRGAAFEDPEFG
ncbi:hypothetical protein B1L11_06315 [Microbispora sp. GKU 823]|nr:hypothetical protein B1L11_06315 [Microbispora sp. GKU 823]